MKWLEHVTHMKRTDMHVRLAGKAEGKIPLGRCRRKWEDSIKIYIIQIEWAK
jgi:hypothetical protein